MSSTAYTPAAFSVATAVRSEVVGCSAWRTMFADQRKDHRFYEIAEDTLENDFEYGYFTISDAAGLIQAVQPFFLLDVLEGLGPAWLRRVDQMRRFFPHFLRLRTLMVGCAAGEAYLAGSDALPPEQVAEILSREIVGRATACGAHLIVLKEFPARYRSVLDCFTRRGFARVPSLPMTTLNIQYDSFESYMQRALPGSARYKLRKNFRATAGETIRMSVTDDAESAIDEIYPLYLQVFKRSKVHFEKLSSNYFRQLGRRMKDKTRFFIWRRADAVVAFSVCMIQDDSLFLEYLGLDYSVALDLHLYYYVHRDIMRWAIANGYKWIRSSGLNYDPKFRMRHVLDPIDLYVRHTSPVANLALRLALPWIVPARYDKVLKRFANYRDLW